uniref:N-terminal Ras-GEF domain-containing protein n=1 Tax=Macrostomum lignano TaxID=282301 RepID=A0A1I8FR07_9PLAT
IRVDSVVRRFRTSGQACPASDRACPLLVGLVRLLVGFVWLLVGLVWLLAGLSGFWSGLSGFWSGLSGFWSGLSGFLVGLVRFWSGFVRLWSGLSGFWSACPLLVVRLLVGFVRLLVGLVRLLELPVCLPLSALPSNRGRHERRHQQAARCFRRLRQVDALRKPPSLRCAADVAALAATFGQLRGFADFTRAGRRAARRGCACVGGVAAPMETLLADGRELEFLVRTCQRRGGGEPAGAAGRSSWRSETPSERRGLSNRRRRGKDRSAPALATGCVFARVPLMELQRVLAAESSRTVELFSPDGSLSLVREVRPSPIGSPTQQLQVATRGTPRGLLDQLTEPRCELTDPGFTEDFLLTYPAFYQSGLPVAKRLLGAAGNQEEPERRTRAIRVLLAWAGSHFDDFAASPELFGVLLRLDQLLRAAAGEEAAGERRLLRLACSTDPVGAGRSASCRSPEPPLAAQGATAGNSVDELEPDDDIDQVDEGLQLRLRVHRLNGAGRQLRLPRDAQVSDVVAASRRAFGCCRDLLPDETAAAVNDAMANDADEVDEVSASTMGFRLLEVSRVVRRRALAPSRPAADLACGVGGGGGGGGVRLYLAGPSEPADLFLASDAETRQLLAEVELESASPSGVGQRNGPLFEYFLAANAKTVANRLTEADFQLHRLVRPRQLVDWWLSGGGGGGPLQSL